MYICLFSCGQAQQALCKSWYCTKVYPLLVKKTEVISALNRDWRRMIPHQWVENGGDYEMEGEDILTRTNIGNSGEIAETWINMATAQPTQGWLFIWEMVKLHHGALIVLCKASGWLTSWLFILYIQLNWNFDTTAMQNVVKIFSLNTKMQLLTFFCLAYG